MGYKMKGSSFYGKNGKSPAKQLKADYMRTPEEKEFYSTSESKDYEPIPAGEMRGIGSYSRYTGPNTTKEGTFGPVSDKKTGDVVSKGVAGSNKKENPRMGPVINEAEFQKRYEKLPPRASFSDDDYKAKDEARTKAYSELTNAERGTEIKPKKKKK